MKKRAKRHSWGFLHGGTLSIFCFAPIDIRANFASQQGACPASFVVPTAGPQCGGSIPTKKLGDMTRRAANASQTIRVFDTTTIMENVLNTTTTATARFSLYAAPVTNKRPMRTVTLAETYDYITGMEALGRTHALRAIADRKEARTFKAKAFDYVMFSGEFAYGNDAGLTRHSGLLCLDFDHVGLPHALWDVRRRLLADDTFDTWLLFTSPSGDGLKWVVDIDLARGDHKTWFRALQNYVRHAHGLEADPTGINVSRACFLPHDPLCHINPTIKSIIF